MADRVHGWAGHEPGGIRGLAGLIGEHRAALEYDWRTRFHEPLKDVGKSMSWGEAHRLTLILLADPSSQIGAAVRSWTYPIERSDMVLRDLFDLQHRSLAKRKPDPYQRPWHQQRKKLGEGTSMSIAEYEALKASAN